VKQPESVADESWVAHASRRNELALGAFDFIARSRFSNEAAKVREAETASPARETRALPGESAT
jgi:hypothetical protein